MKTSENKFGFVNMTAQCTVHCKCSLHRPAQFAGLIFVCFCFVLFCFLPEARFRNMLGLELGLVLANVSVRVRVRPRNFAGF
jgi:hypothetical protein